MLRHTIMIWIDAARHSQRQVVPVRDRALALCRLDYGRLQVFGECEQGIVGAGQINTTARVYQRILGIGYNARALLDAVCACGLALVVDGFEQFNFCYIGERLRRNLNLHRARPARLELVKRLMHRFGHIARVENALRPLGNRANRVKLVVDFVQNAAVTPNHVALHLSRHNHDR